MLFDQIVKATRDAKNELRATISEFMPVLLDIMHTQESEHLLTYIQEPTVNFFAADARMAESEERLNIKMHELPKSSTEAREQVDKEYIQVTTDDCVVLKEAAIDLLQAYYTALPETDKSRHILQGFLTKLGAPAPGNIKHRPGGPSTGPRH